MIYFILIFFIIVFILFMPIYINISVLRENNNDNIELKFFLLKGIIKFGIEIPLIDIVNTQEGVSVEVQNKVEEGSKEKDISKNKDIISMKKIVEKVNQLLKYKEIVLEIQNYLMDKIKIIRIHWFTRLGLENAAITAVLVGNLWSLKSFLISFISSYKSTNNIKIDITPEFNSNIFETSFNCIIKFKLVYIIKAGISGLRVKMKGGRNCGRTSNRRTYANNNGKH